MLRDPEVVVGDGPTAATSGARNYANDAVVWFTRSFDAALVVSRVRFPPLFMFELIRRLNTAMSGYERKHGEIPRYDDEP